MTRLPPLPDTVSAAARAAFGPPAAAISGTLAERRAADSANQARISEAQQRRYGVVVTDGDIRGVPVRRFRPKDPSALSPRRVMIALHGGGFILGSDSAENIPLAALTGIEVVSILYRLAPEHPYPAAVDDVISVYRELLGAYDASDIALYGSSAGAILAAEAIVRMRDEDLPAPAALGFFSGSADLSRGGDSWAIFGPRSDRSGDQPIDFATAFSAYLGANDPSDPKISPLLGDLAGFPPTLCVTGTRDFLLSQTSLFARALRRAGVAATLVVFEGMPHTHWGDPDLPESEEAFAVMAAFLGGADTKARPG